MKISEVKIIPVTERDGLVAFASCIINSQFYFGSIAIRRRLNSDGYRLTYPTKKLGDQDLETYFPINKETYDAIYEEVINKYKGVNNDTRGSKKI